MVCIVKANKLSYKYLLSLKLKETVEEDNPDANGISLAPTESPHQNSIEFLSLFFRSLTHAHARTLF